MPEYARDENGAVFNTEWNLPNGQYKPNMFPTRMASILPATEEEYNAFQIAKLKEQK